MQRKDAETSQRMYIKWMRFEGSVEISMVDCMLHSMKLVMDFIRPCSKVIKKGGEIWEMGIGKIKMMV